jgi:hypothetical protein
LQASAPAVPPPLSPPAAPIAFDSGTAISKPKKRGRPKKDAAAAAITASVAGGLVDASQIADIAATHTACGDDAGTTQGGLRRSGRKKGFAAKISDNVYQQAEKTLINSLAAANKACRTAQQAFHMGSGDEDGCASGDF